MSNPDDGSGLQESDDDEDDPDKWTKEERAILAEHAERVLEGNITGAQRTALERWLNQDDEESASAS